MPFKPLIHMFLRTFVLTIYFISVTLLSGAYAPEGSPANQQEGGLNTYKEQLKKARKEGNTNLAAQSLNRIAYYHWNNKNYQKALNHFQMALPYQEKMGNKNGIQKIRSNMGLIYTDIKEYSKAIDEFKTSLQHSKELKNKKSATSAQINIGMAYTSMEDYGEAVSYLEKALANSKELGNKDLIRNCYSLLADAHRNLGNEKQAYTYFNKYTTLKAAIKEEQLKKEKQQAQKLAQKNKERKEQLEKKKQELTEKEKEIVKQKSRIELLNKQKQLKAEKVREQEKRMEAQQKAHKAKMQKTRIVMYGSFGVLFLVATFFLILFRNYRQKKKINEKLDKQNKEIAEKNEHITSSINYARRIQEAMLPAEDGLNKVADDSFIYFNPRDIVSGDFYWYYNLKEDTINNRQINHLLSAEEQEKIKEETNKLVVAAVDCTGHGVPGAFMSMIGIKHLNSIVNKGITSPDEILEHMHNDVRQSLKQETSENKDGMDMALCTIDPQNKVLEFAGAKNPLVYIQDGEVHKIKGSKRPIGGGLQEEHGEFTKSTLSLDKPVSVYLFSDGFPDQFGGPEDKKFMSKRLQRLLLDNHHLPMKEQKEVLDRTMRDWMGTTYSQLDDILVMGFHLNFNN